jgi:hypothetical protein
MDLGVIRELVSDSAGTGVAALVVQLDGIICDINQRIVRKFIFDRVIITGPGLDIGKIAI